MNNGMNDTDPGRRVDLVRDAGALGEGEHPHHHPRCEAGAMATEPSNRSCGAHCCERALANTAAWPPWECPIATQRVPISGAIARGQRHVGDRTLLGLTDEISVRPRRTQTLIVGLRHRVSGCHPLSQGLAGQRGVVVGGNSAPVSREGAHTSAVPVVPCAQEISGQPPGGGVPSGTATVPDTATGCPCHIHRPVEHQEIVRAR